MKRKQITALLMALTLTTGAVPVYAYEDMSSDFTQSQPMWDLERPDSEKDQASGKTDPLEQYDSVEDLEKAYDDADHSAVTQDDTGIDPSAESPEVQGAEGSSGDESTEEGISEDGDINATDPTDTFAGFNKTDSQAFSVMFGTDIDTVFADMKQSLANGGTFSFADSLSKFSDLDLMSQSLCDMSDMQLASSINMTLTNLQYYNLVGDLMESRAGKDVSGQSVGCMNLFQNTYGDVVDQTALEEPQIPKGFTVESMLSTGEKAIDNAYADVSKSDVFKTVKKNISIGAIFDAAEKGLETPQLASSSELESMLGSTSSSIKKQISNEYSSNKSKTNSKLSAKQDVQARLNSEMLKFSSMNNAILSKDGTVNTKNAEAWKKRTKTVSAASTINDFKEIISILTDSARDKKSDADKKSKSMTGAVRGPAIGQ